MITEITVFLGLPGTGKGTQSQKIQEKIGIMHVSCGDVFRQHVASGTDFGLRAKAYISEGLLTPDVETSEMFLTHLSSLSSSNIILEGYPRTISQAISLDEFCQDQGGHLRQVFLLEAPRDVIIQRIGGRQVCRKCGRTYHAEYAMPAIPGICDVDGDALTTRSDDAAHIVAPRLALYAEQERAVVDHYKNRGILKRIDAAESPDRVFETIMKLMIANN